MNKQLPIIIAIILVLGLGGFGVWKLTQSDSSKQETKNETDQQSNAQQEQPTPTAAETQKPVTDNTQPATNAPCVKKNISTEQLSAPYAANAKYVILDVERYGKVKIQLNYTDAPKSSQNFAKLASLGFYDCLTFHRVIEGFVVQGGDPEGTGAGGPGYTIPAEIKLPHKKGSIAMARTGDQVNPKRDSSGSQFYIALQDLPQLDNQYTVFGQVVEGMDVVSKIGVVKTNPDDSPQNKVIILSATTSDK